MLFAALCVISLASVAGILASQNIASAQNSGEDSNYKLLRSMTEIRFFFKPLQAPKDMDPAKVELGRRLYFDSNLASGGNISCAACHDLANGGADGLKRPIGANGEPMLRNSPTIFNSSMQFAQLWDGRFKAVEGVIEREMTSNATWQNVVNTISSNTGYRSRFAKIYDEGVTPETIMNAIATFVSVLVTPNSPFDRYLEGDGTALTSDERAGLELFMDFGCSSCHQGQLLGGNLFQRLGVHEEYFSASDPDQGRFGVTGEESDRHIFKVPSLRNVALTAPYLHDGSAATLEVVIKTMARYQLGRNLNADEIAKIAAFLRSLTGEPPAFLGLEDAQ